MSKEVYEVYRKKGARLKAEMSPLVNRYFYATLEGKAWKGIHMFDKAHTVMLTEEGIIPKDAGIEILKAFRKMEKEDAEQIRKSLGGHLDPGEAYLTKTIGRDIAGWIHCGRSSGDLSVVAHRIGVRDGALTLMKDLINIRKTMLKKAEAHVNTIMPGYTHLQNAEPVTLGFYLLSFLHQFERDFERFKNAYKHTNISAAGCAILTTTNFPINRKRTQELLGFDDIFKNARDAVWSMDYFVEYLGVIMGTAGILSRLADDLHIWHSSEFGMVEVPDAFCGTSSIMPQKKNSYGTEAVRGLNGDVIGYVMAFLAQTNHQSEACEMKTMSPLCVYNAVERCRVALEIMEGIIKDLKVNKEIMKERAGMFWTQATSLANALVMEKGIPFRTAHQIVAILVRTANEKGKQSKDVTPAMVDMAAKEFNAKPLGMSRASLKKALDTEMIVKSKKCIGGTAPERIEEDIKDSYERIIYDEKTIGIMEGKLAKSEKKLELAIDKLIGRS